MPRARPQLVPAPLAEPQTPLVPLAESGVVVALERLSLVPLAVRTPQVKLLLARVLLAWPSLARVPLVRVVLA